MLQQIIKRVADAESKQKRSRTEQFTIFSLLAKIDCSNQFVNINAIKVTTSCGHFDEIVLDI